MGTKRQPGKFDCYAKLEEDEPYFVLRGNDPVGGYLVAAWVHLRAGDLEMAISCLGGGLGAMKTFCKPLLLPDNEKSREASACAMAMMDWHIQKRIKAHEAVRPEKIAGGKLHYQEHDD